MRLPKAALCTVTKYWKELKDPHTALVVIPEAGFERIHSCVHTKALSSSPLPDLSAVPEDSPSVPALTGPLLQ